MIHCETIVTQEQDYFLHDIDINTCQEKIKEQLSADHKEPIHTVLGTSFVDSYYYEYTLNSDQGVQTKVWFQEDEIVSIEVYKTWTISGEIKQSITQLGAATLKLDYYLDVIPMKEKVWVYPEKGIALFFGFDEESIYRVAYFKATTAEDYMSRLYDAENPREFEI